MRRAAKPQTVNYYEGTPFSHRQLTSPRKLLVPQETILGKRREHVDCNEAAIAEAVDGFETDDHVSIAAGALRSVFGNITARDMGVPDAAEDHHAILIRVGKVRDVLKSTDRRRSDASHRS